MSFPVSVNLSLSNVISAIGVDDSSDGRGSYGIYNVCFFVFPNSCFTNVISSTLQGSSFRLRG